MSRGLVALYVGQVTPVITDVAGEIYSRLRKHAYIGNLAKAAILELKAFALRLNVDVDMVIPPRSLTEVLWMTERRTIVLGRTSSSTHFF